MPVCNAHVGEWKGASLALARLRRGTATYWVPQIAVGAHARPDVKTCATHAPYVCASPRSTTRRRRGLTAEATLCRWPKNARRERPTNRGRHAPGRAQSSLAPASRAVTQLLRPSRRPRNAAAACSIRGGYKTEPLPVAHTARRQRGPRPVRSSCRCSRAAQGVRAAAAAAHATGWPPRSTSSSWPPRPAAPRRASAAAPSAPRA